MVKTIKHRSYCQQQKDGTGDDALTRWCAPLAARGCLPLVTEQYGVLEIAIRHDSHKNGKQKADPADDQNDVRKTEVTNQENHYQEENEFRFVHNAKGG